MPQLDIFEHIYWQLQKYSLLTIQSLGIHKHVIVALLLRSFCQCVQKGLANNFKASLQPTVKDLD